MRKLLVFQHVPYEPLGLLDGYLKEAGLRIRYLNFQRRPELRVDVGRYHGLVVLGGPMSANQTDRYPHLRYEQEAIGEAVHRGLPVLGICLGAQLMAVSLGGRSLPGAAVELGWSRVEPTADGVDDPLIGQLHGGQRIFQWHSDTFTLPSAAVHLARSAGCEHQAFRIGDAAYGFQFHLEADRRLIARWVGNEAHVRELERLGGTPVDRGVIADETRRYLNRAERLGRAVFGEFIERFYRWRRRRVLPSR
jgi:GMP synthase (glutamine-hydrolysing)